MKYEQRIFEAVNSWISWLPRWEPPTYRTRGRICRRCTGSPIVAAAGLNTGVPHQVVHALVTKIHRLIDHEVDEYTAANLPMLQAELDATKLWESGGFDAKAMLPDDVDPAQLDPVLEEGDHPYLFTFAQLEEETSQKHTLPLPPLTAAEKDQLRKEMHLADEYATTVGGEMCFALMPLRERIALAVAENVEPKIQRLIDELGTHLLNPPS